MNKLPTLHFSGFYLIAVSGPGILSVITSLPNRPFARLRIAFSPNELGVLHIIVGRLLMKMLPNDAMSGALLFRKCYTC